MNNMAYKALLSFLLTMFFSSCLHVVLCQTSLDQLLPGLTAGHGLFLQDAHCMQKLIPCQEYVKAPNNPPPETCCGPLREMHEGQTQCLCNLANNPKLLQSINASKDNIMKLPQACGIDLDLSNCNTTEASSPAAEGEFTVPDEDTSEVKDSESSINSPYGVLGFVASLTALVFSTY